MEIQLLGRWRWGRLWSRPAWAKKFATVKLGTVAHVCHTSYPGSINRRLVMQVGPGKNARPYPKKRLGHGLAGQVPA
jgi:hypothetical protein